MPNAVADNLRKWDEEHDWAKDGDEWSGQARACGVPYRVWKASLIEHLIAPHAAGAAVLEIAPGRGRWSEAIVERAARVVLVDLSPSCIEACRARFGEGGAVEYHVNDGASLPAGLDGEIDFVFSFDSFVHMEGDVIGAYLREGARVLRPGGRMVIHHAGRSRPWLGFLREFGEGGRSLYRRLSMGADEPGDGWRSAVSGPMVARLAAEAGLEVERQASHWGDGTCGVPRFRDLVTTLRRPGG